MTGIKDIVSTTAADLHKKYKGFEKEHPYVVGAAKVGALITAAGSATPILLLLACGKDGQSPAAPDATPSNPTQPTLPKPTITTPAEACNEINQNKTDLFLGTSRFLMVLEANINKEGLNPNNQKKLLVLQSTLKDVLACTDNKAQKEQIVILAFALAQRYLNGNDGTLASNLWVGGYAEAIAPKTEQEVSNSTPLNFATSYIKLNRISVATKPDGAQTLAKNADYKDLNSAFQEYGLPSLTSFIRYEIVNDHNSIQGAVADALVQNADQVTVSQQRASRTGKNNQGAPEIIFTLPITSNGNPTLFNRLVADKVSSPDPTVREKIPSYKGTVTPPSPTGSVTTMEIAIVAQEKLADGSIKLTLHASANASNYGAEGSVRNGFFINYPEMTVIIPANTGR